VLRRFAFLLALVVLLIGIGVIVDLQDSPQVRAGPPPAVTVRDAAAVRDRGMAVSLATRSVAGVGVLEPRFGAELGAAGPLAATLDGSALAMTSVPAGQVGPLTLARADGSQIEVSLPGVRGAAFEPAGSWLAVVDVSGALWRVDAATGAATPVADGPFGPDVTVLPGGDVLVIRMSSVEAPTWAAAQRIDPDGGDAVAVGAADAQTALVYRATALIDGSVALVRHRIGGGVDLARIAPDGLEMDLAHSPQPGVTISPSGDRLAWAADGSVWLASVGEEPSPVAVGSGSAGSFSPDGSLLMIIGPNAAGVVDLAGNRRSDLVASACWLGGGRGCRP
jgi:hypothetical protein